MAGKMRQIIQDIGVMIVITTPIIVIFFFLGDWIGFDLKVSAGWISASIYYSWYKKGK